MRLSVLSVHSVQLLLVALLALLPCSQPQDLSVYGLFDSYVNPIDRRKMNKVYSSCFQGLGLVTCIPVIPDDDIEEQYLRPYLRDLEDIQGSNYCVECCGDPPNRRDVWDLYCEVDEDSRREVNVYGFELRMARNRDSQDETVITCPLKRSECSYSSSGETLGCNRTTETAMFLTGYTLKLTVEQHDKNFEYWRGVSKCEIETEERNTSLQVGEKFHEKIVLIHEPTNTLSVDDAEKLAILGLLGILLIYVFLYFCRKKHCEYCQQKLVFSPRICYKCKLVGAQPPDPELLKAMEKRGAELQGQAPVAFPGASVCVGMCRGLYSVLCSCYHPNPRKVLPDFEEEDAEIARREEEEYARITAAAAASVQPFGEFHDSEEEKVEDGRATALENTSSKSPMSKSSKSVKINERANSKKVISTSSPVAPPDEVTKATQETAAPVKPATKRKKKPGKVKNPNIMLYSSETIQQGVTFISTKPQNQIRPHRESLFA